jgi:FKBP-type peptidyl-prolyl cis-trans isomerase SlyD
MRIANDCLVSIRFTLTNDAGQVLDSSPEGKPLVYLHGAEGILPALERELTGKEAGDRFDLTITPESGFGTRQPALVEVLPRSVLQDADQLAIGRWVTRSDETGAQASYCVTAFDADTVTLDGNHPLAGMTLRFEGVVVDVREGSAEDLPGYQA